MRFIAEMTWEELKTLPVIEDPSKVNWETTSPFTFMETDEKGHTRRKYIHDAYSHIMDVAICSS